MPSESSLEAEANLVGIRGWLAIPALHAVVFPLLSLYQIYNAHSVLAIGVAVLALGVQGFVAERFFRRSPSAPKLMIANYALAVALFWFWDALTARAVIHAVLWSFYMTVSRRVSNTFVEPEEEAEPAA